METKDDLNVVVPSFASSTLFLPCRWDVSGRNLTDASAFLAFLASQTFLNSDNGNSELVWKRRDRPPAQALSLETSFLRHSGFDVVEQLDLDPDSPPTSPPSLCVSAVHLFEMNVSALRRLFPSPSVAFESSASVLFKPVAVCLNVLPAGGCIAQFSVEWTGTSDGRALTVDIVGHILSMLLYHRDVDARFLGIVTGDSKTEKGVGGKLSLSDVCELLVGKRMTRLPSHQTLVVLPRRKEEYDVTRMVSRLTRGKDSSVTVRVLRLRKHRHIGVAREGVTAVTWQRVDVEQPMKWPSEFMSAYRLLQLYILGAQTTLSQLSQLVSAEAERLRLTTSKYSIDELVRYRNEMHNLVAWTTQLSLLYVNDECGGTSDHHTLYDECRLALGIGASYAQLSLSVDALMKIMDHLYALTKQMVLTEKHKAMKRRELIQEKRQQREDERLAEVECRKKGFEIAVGIVSAVALPAAVTTSFFGMNLSDLPMSVSYQSVLLGCFVAALTFLVIFSSIICIPRRYCCTENGCGGLRGHHARPHINQIPSEDDEEDLI